MLKRFCHLVILDKYSARKLLLDGSFSSFKLCKRSTSTQYKLNLKPRKNPAIMKLDTPEFRNLFTTEVEILSKLFDNHGFEIRIAGGAVRDLLLGIQPADLDFATTATPTEMIKLFTEENIRMINMNGEKHGTITARINDKSNFEVTTLRRDVKTDGRHAIIEFTTDWLVDANRRDLTINSMFLGFDGTVYDYFHGHEDLINKRVVFVGDAAQRIQEDYLRILRYFRFYGKLVPEPNKHESSTLQAIKENAAGIKQISGERIWLELNKILEGNHSGDLLKTMLELGCGEYIGLSVDCDVEEMLKVWSYCKTYDWKLKAVTLIVTLCRNVEDFLKLHERVKFSAFDRELGLFVINNRSQKRLDVKPLKPYQLMVLNANLKSNDAIKYVEEVLKYKGEIDLYNEFLKWELPRFPVTGTMLKEKGIAAGKLMGKVMFGLRTIWSKHDFQSTSEELLENLPQVLETIELDVKKSPKRLKK